jgi:hypothetical protein
VEAVRGSNRERGDWVFSWRKNLFVWEEEIIISLLEDLEGLTRGNHEDRWFWKAEKGVIFFGEVLL